MNNYIDIGSKAYQLAKKLFPICRSITGKGFRDSLEILNQELNNKLNMYNIPSGTKCFDWEIPEEWNINDAYILTPNGDKICDFKVNNLHVLNYSIPVNKTITLEELNEHLYSLPELPEAIPYVTSYYKKRWGFCIKHKERQNLKKGNYKVFIDSSCDKNGRLTYADYVVKATNNSDKEILFSTYLCHPSMANNELSGPCVMIYIIKALEEYKKQCGLKYNYRFIVIPETIGSIAYLSNNLEQLQKNVVAGYVLSCVGDNSSYSLVHSPNENTLSDKIAKHILSKLDNFKEYDFTKRGSDERQYCSPLVNLPICGICRTKYGEYKEYHTSMDNLDFISKEGLMGAYMAIIDIIKTIEINNTYIINTICEPNLGKRGLYRTINIGGQSRPIISEILAWCNGKNDLIDIADKMNIKAIDLQEDIENLLKHNLIRTL